jgi:hypothetical protein
MEQSNSEAQEQAVTTLPVQEEPTASLAPAVQPAKTVTAQACSTCGTVAPASNGGPIAAPSWVYAVGRIEARFPSISVEKEFVQATGRSDAKGLTDRQTLQTVLSKAENRYLARQICCVMTIEGLETYILVPRDPSDISLLLDALRPTPQPWDLDVVIGMKGPIAPPTMCNGLMVPIVIFDQIYSFDRETLIKAIPRPEKTSAKEFAPAAEELFDRIMQMTDNAGATDDNRALNYLAMRYQAIYAKAAEYFAQNCSLTGLYVNPSALSSTRNIVEVVFAYTNRNTDVVDKCFVRVDVTDEFPFLTTKLSPYYDR